MGRRARHLVALSCVVAAPALAGCAQGSEIGETDESSESKSGDFTTATTGAGAGATSGAPPTSTASSTSGGNAAASTSGSSGVGGAASGGAGGDAAGGGPSNGSGGSGGVFVPTGYWPDSQSAYCSDGAVDVSPCPKGAAPGAGQDGTHAIYVPLYVSSPIVTKDPYTGLAWQRDASGPEVAWTDALAACDALVLGGDDDWRLPSRLELSSIFDYGIADPAVPPMPFPGATQGALWTSTPSSGDPTAAWRIDLGSGSAGVAAGSELHGVRCVRDQIFAGVVTVSMDALTVLDTTTSYEWQRDVQPPLTWIDAVTACNALVHAGHSDWRLASAKELQTIVDDATQDPAIDSAAFPATPLEAFWTSTPRSGMPDIAHTIDFATGAGAVESTATARAFRCVR